MSDPVPTAADSALAELLEVSPQVDAAVILERDGGKLLASAPASSSRMADRFGAISTRILDAAEQARTELGREPVSQVEVASPDGHVFVVADSSWVVAAVTDADPTVGLVFYDLKTALRAVREAGAGAAASSNGAPAAIVTPTSDGDDAAEVEADAEAATSTGDEPDADAGSEAEAATQPQGGNGRWRRKKS